MDASLRHNVRAVLLTPQREVLLMRVSSRPGRNLWITPGGGVSEGETAHEGLARELLEETGVQGPSIGPELWVRQATFRYQGQLRAERERIFLVLVDRYEPRVTHMESEERSVFREFRWWTVEEITASGEAFAPTRLGELLLDLLAKGPPAEPLDSGE